MGHFRTRFLCGCLGIWSGVCLLSGSAAAAGTELADGVTYARGSISGGSGTQEIHWVDMDPATMHAQIRLGLPGGKVGGTATVLELASAAEQAGNRVVAAINGGPFSIGDPLGIPADFLIQDRDIYTDPDPYGESPYVLAIDEEGKAFIDQIPQLDMRFSIDEGPEYHIQHLNRTRADVNENEILNTCILYTERFGPSTQTEEGGKELIIRVDRGGARGGAVLKGKIVGITDKGNAKIEPGHVVLSVTEYWEDELGAADVGEEISISFTFDDDRWNTVKLATGGTARLLENGTVPPDLDREPKTEEAPAYTAIGLRPDGRMLWAVVDGSGKTSGCTQTDLANWLREQGCTEAIALDGGGSSTLAIHPPKGELTIQNTPANYTGMQRKLSNGILLLAKEPEKPEFVGGRVIAAVVCLAVAGLCIGWLVRRRRREKPLDSDAASSKFTP